MTLKSTPLHHQTHLMLWEMLKAGVTINRAEDAVEGCQSKQFYVKKRGENDPFVDSPFEFKVDHLLSNSEENCT